jgi:predicted GNAT family N-acyltransferase
MSADALPNLLTSTMSEPTLTIVPVDNPGDLAQALAIREVVFIEEQRVPETMERDEEDARAFHVLAYEGKHAIGTGRLVDLSQPPENASGHWGKIGRMAVLAAHRKGGVGSRILETLEAEARKRHYDGIVLHAQVHARDFYVKHGYQDHGGQFEEANMPHLQMRKRL